MSSIEQAALILSKIESAFRQSYRLPNMRPTNPFSLFSFDVPMSNTTGVPFDFGADSSEKTVPTFNFGVNHVEKVVPTFEFGIDTDRNEKARAATIASIGRPARGHLPLGPPYVSGEYVVARMTTGPHQFIVTSHGRGVNIEPCQSSFLAMRETITQVCDPGPAPLTGEIVDSIDDTMCGAPIYSLDTIDRRHEKRVVFMIEKVRALTSTHHQLAQNAVLLKRYEFELAAVRAEISPLKICECELAAAHAEILSLRQQLRAAYTALGCVERVIDDARRAKMDL